MSFSFHFHSISNLFHFFLLFSILFVKRMFVCAYVFFFFLWSHFLFLSCVSVVSLKWRISRDVSAALFLFSKATDRVIVEWRLLQISHRSLTMKQMRFSCIRMYVCLCTVAWMWERIKEREEEEERRKLVSNQFALQIT